MMIPPRDFTLPFLRREQLAKDAYSFFFDRTLLPDFDFLPGQYLRVTLPIENPDIRGNSHNFSIASSPLTKNELMITTRIIQSTFKKTLYSLTPGTKTQFFGPAGRFIFDESETIPHVFLAGGIGVTPFHSMLTYIAEKNSTTPVTLFVSFATPEDFVYFDEFTKISHEHTNVKIIYTVTKPEESQMPWTGETGRISAEMIQKYVPNIRECLTFTCGSMAMVKGTIEILTAMGVPPEHIRKENFVGY